MQIGSEKIRFFQFLRKKKEPAETGKPEVKKPELKKVKQELPEISETEQKKYIGKHIAIVGGKIVASANTAERTLAMAKQKHSGKEIILRYVGSERLLLKCKCFEKG